MLDLSMPEEDTPIVTPIANELEALARAAFDELVELPEGAAREARFADCCGGDNAVIARVRALLESYRAAGRFLSSPTLHAEASSVGAMNGSLPTLGRNGADDSPTPASSQFIGSYKVLEEIGEGGFGTVYMAEQHEPIRRLVALKLIKAGMDTRQVIARFNAERQALALMDHPNIARVLDAGATDAGRPYFVMELVRGTLITAYCDRNNLSLRERLELFMQVCHAVQHAHQKGIIHRDLKPSNVLVALVDGRPVPKVIDFGVAKATGGSLIEKTLFTNFTHMIGTPLYMSPEQAEMMSQDIDTRSDIYSLGVLLYELLTGTTPFDHDRLKSASFDEMRRIIREEEPPRPSTRITTLAQAAARTVCTQRRSEPRTLRRRLRGELDWIVMKCLEKDRGRRYDTANSIAADLVRYLNDEPVLARPPSSAYRLGKFALRNRMALCVAALVAGGLIVAIVILAVGNTLIREEQAHTREEKTTAERRAEQLRQGEMDLQAAHRSLERGRISMDEQHWDDAESAFTRAIELRPEYAGPWDARAELYARLGLFDLALADVNRAYQLQEPNVSWRWVNLALLRFNASDVRGVRQASARLRTRIREVAAPEFVRDMVRVGALANDPDADPITLVDWGQDYVAWNLGDSFRRYLAGLAHYRAGQFEQADADLQAALTLQPDWETSRIALPVRAMTYHRLGRAADARSALKEAARTIDDWTRRICQADNVNWAVNQGVGNWPVFWWDWLECKLYYREACLLIDGESPPEDPRLHLIRARGFAGLRRAEQAIDEYTAAVQALPDDLQIQFELYRTRGYAYAYRDWRRSALEFAEARRLMPDQAGIWSREAIAQLAAADRKAYRQTCREMLERFSATEDPDAAGDIVHACVLEADAVPHLERLIPLAQVAARLNHSSVRIVGAAYCRAGRYEDAVRELEDSARLMKPKSWDWCFLAMAHMHLGHTADAERCLQAAERWIAEAHQPPTESFWYSQQVWGGFTERFEFGQLYAEAAALVSTPDAVSAPAPADLKAKGRQGSL